MTSESPSGTDHTDNDTNDTEDDFEVLLARTRSYEPDFLGLSPDEARALAEHLGLQLRVIDSDTDAVDASLRSNRITVDARTGTVATATAG